MDDAGNTARQQPMTGRMIMQIKSIVAGAAIALAAATSLASASDELSPHGGAFGESLSPVTDTASGYWGLTNANRLDLDTNPAEVRSDLGFGGVWFGTAPEWAPVDLENDDLSDLSWPGKFWTIGLELYIRGHPGSDLPTTTPPGSSTPTTPDPAEDTAQSVTESDDQDTVPLGDYNFPPGPPRPRISNVEVTIEDLPVEYVTDVEVPKVNTFK